MTEQTKSTPKSDAREPGSPRWRAIYESPGRLLLIIAASIFVSHTLAMEALSAFFPGCPMLTQVLLESALLSLLLFPILYFYSFRPLIVHIRERDQAEEAMHQSEYKYRHLFENLSDAVFLTVVGTGRILDTNKRGEALLCRPRTEILGMNHNLLFSPEHLEGAQSRLAEYAARDAVAQYESAVIRKDGTTTDVHISGIPITLYERRVVIELFQEVPK